MDADVGADVDVSPDPLGTGQSAPSGVAVPAPGRVRRARVWPAFLALYLLAPMTGELMSGSTPPLAFLTNPFSVVFVPLLYGSSAVLIHEVAVRRRLGWGNILLLGAGFGIFQEGLVVQTWFNFAAKDSPSYVMRSFGVLFGTSWPWALSLTLYHAVISITLPLIVLGLLFPRRAAVPWLGRTGMLALLLWLVVPCILVGIWAANASYPHEGYAAPPAIGYTLAAVLMMGSLVAGVRLRFPAPKPNLRRRAPSLWVVRLGSFALTTLFFVLYIVLPHTPSPAILAMLAVALPFAAGVWRIRGWSARAGWGPRHWLAVVVGVLAYFVLLWGPLLELVLRKPAEVGLTLANVLIFAGLLVLDWRLKRHPAIAVAPIPATPEAPTPL